MSWSAPLGTRITGCPDWAASGSVAQVASAKVSNHPAGKISNFFASGTPIERCSRTSSRVSSR
jgi:hypothetical protein